VYDNGPREFRSIVNMNFLIQGALSQRPGSALYTGATIIGQLTGGVEFERLNGASYIVVTANTNAYTATAAGFNAFKTGLLNNALCDFTTLVDRLFAANGNDFFKFDGSNTSNYSLPYGITTFGVTQAVGGSLTPGVTGVFTASYGYVNDRSYYGPAGSGITITINGITFNSISYYNMSVPSGYGISAIAFYRTSNNGAALFGTTTMDAGAVSGATFVDNGFPLSTRLNTGSFYLTLIPKYFEVFNNQLFMAGFSGFLSTAYWSEIGEPEAVDPASFAEFRTNDGDRITGMRTYQGSLVVSKQRSLHRVTGTDPTNFIISEITDQYGNLSKRTMLVWEDQFWCLDAKGIVSYNGANVGIVSNKVEDVFMRMNIPAAIDNATAIHYKQFNEVWFSIPVDGSTINNLIVVFDYIAQAWTTYEGIAPSVLFLAKQTFTQKQPFFGGYSGSLSYLSATLPNDNGRAITCRIQTAFDIPRGQTTESLFRRFYMNVSSVLGITAPITINLRTNYGSTIQSTQTMYRSQFQSRVDFGLPGRSIQAEVVYSSASFPLTVFGYGWDSRFQRSV
jgi:hypothetical protein